MADQQLNNLKFKSRDDGGVEYLSHFINVVSKVNADSPYTVLLSDHTILCDCTNGDITVNLPAVASCTGLVLNIKKIAGVPANTVTIDPNGTEEIDGSSSSLTAILINASFTMQCDGSAWWIL